MGARSAVTFVINSDASLQCCKGYRNAGGEGEVVDEEGAFGTWRWSGKLGLL